MLKSILRYKDSAVAQQLTAAKAKNAMPAKILLKLISSIIIKFCCLLFNGFSASSDYYFFAIDKLK